LNTAELKFTSIFEFPSGALAAIIRDSYRSLTNTEPDFWREQQSKWNAFDHDAYAHPNTIGHCVFLTLVENEIVGLASFDPREAPQWGRIGQNCILPQFQRRGFGKLQIAEILRRFQERGIQTARVKSCEHPFFIAAQRLYQGCNFHEVRRYRDRSICDWELIEYEWERRYAPMKRLIS
jgi:GNAT superfamily N-acetyltransferase